MSALVRSLILTLCILAPTTAFAERIMSLPKGAAVVRLTMPDDWVMHSDVDEFDASSPDQKMYMRFVFVTGAALEDRIGGAFRFLAKNRITVRQESMTQRTGAVRGFALTETLFDATDALGPASVKLSIVAVSEEKFLVTLVWSTPEGQEAWGGKLDGVMESLSLTK